MESPRSTFLLRNCWHSHLSLFAWDKKQKKMDASDKSPVIMKGFRCGNTNPIKNLKRKNFIRVFLLNKYPVFSGHLSGSQPVNREIQLKCSSSSSLQMNKHVTNKVLQFREDSTGDVIIAFKKVHYFLQVRND